MEMFISKNEKNDYASDKYINVNSCGCRHNFDYTIIRKNGRLDYHLLYICSGKCRAQYDGIEYLLTPGDFIIYYPGQTQMYSFDNDNGCDTMWIHFSGTATAEILEGLKLHAGVFRCRFDEKIYAVFKELVQEHQAKPYIQQSAENVLLIYLLTIISRITRNIDNRRKVTDIENVIMAMSNSFDEPYDINKYAKICSLSPSRFSHKFKQVMGKAPLKYFINIKLKRAKEFLKFSDLSISEIAERVGYDNPLYFSRTFRKAFGISPTGYRNKEKQRE